MYIRGRGKIGYLVGEAKEPKKTDPSYAIWDAENSMVMAWLVNAMDEEISANYMCYSTAKELWDNVSQMYSDLGNYSQIYELQQKISNTYQGDSSVTRYFNVLKGLCQDLDLFNDYEWKNPANCDHNKKMVENARIFKFLAGLNDEFDEEDETVEKSALVATNNPAPHAAGNTNLATANISAQRPYSNQKRLEDKPRVWCDYCNKPLPHSRKLLETLWKASKLEEQQIWTLR
ncbi:hypothetical protein F0562_005984 [Nyssa sinensis]|uniref:Retrotransposon gag domain-containing protein n=1 Tax=Nyssa sinensis TaxID=561372 RepID=A0A5J5AJP1_9ASTE|nr:hypothetical protein F0562_005984 [Nyssa sinensis]